MLHSYKFAIEYFILTIKQIYILEGIANAFEPVYYIFIYMTQINDIIMKSHNGFVDDY